MDIINSHFTPQQATKLNRIRLSLKLLTLSDVADIRGKVVLQNIKKHQNNRQSTLTWPMQPLPKKNRRLWTEACVIFQRYLSRSPLGSWTHIQQKWTWKTNVDHTIISDGVAHYQKFVVNNRNHYKLIYSPTLQLPHIADVYFYRKRPYIVSSSPPITSI